MRALLSGVQGLQPQAAAALVLLLVRPPLVSWLARLLLAALALQLQAQLASAVAAGR